MAFIASTTDDPAKVIAVCIEEGTDGKSMAIKLAVNTGVLDNVVLGLRGIADLLHKANHQGRVLETFSFGLDQRSLTEKV